jgi:uroporphyrinogen-III decarboxylase
MILFHMVVLNFLLLFIYLFFQISCGAEVIQVFESWAHFLSEDLFSTFVMVRMISGSVIIFINTCYFILKC